MAEELEMVVVPARPGPLVRPEQLVRQRDELDDVLDDLFGEPDERGAGVSDAVMVGGGVAAIAVGQLAHWPVAVTVAGGCLAVFGAILPARSAWRRATTKRRAAQLRDAIGDGTVLRTSNAAIAAFVAAHDHVLSVGGRRDAEVGRRAASAAHAAALEVATLLDGRSPLVAEEVAYVAARTDALNALVVTMQDPRAVDRTASERRAMVEARQEIDRLAGTSSLADVAALRRDLLGDATGDDGT